MKMRCSLSLATHPLDVIVQHFSIEIEYQRLSICERFWSFVFRKKYRKNISAKYTQKLLGHAKQPATDAPETATNTAIPKAAETTGDLISNKITGKITSTVSRSNPDTVSQTDEKSIEIPNERYISSEKKTK